jgi:carbon-monoxide dehydrogenase large subunit
MSILGTRVIRTEDPRLLTAGGVYVDDLRTPELNGAARVTFVRSPVAHARITGIDASAALAEPGVIAVLTVADMDDLAPPPPSSGEWDGSPAPLGGPWAEPLLAIDTVRFVGEPVAVVITDGRRFRRDPAVPCRRHQRLRRAGRVRRRHPVRRLRRGRRAGLR